MHIIRFRKWNCNLQFEQYNNGRTAITLTEVETGDPIAVATVNIPEVELGPDEVLIKDYSENQGILASLVRNSIVSEPLYFYNSVYVQIPICKLLIKPE